MANRVTTEEVLAIIDTSLTDIAVFVATANMLVTAHLGGAGLSDETLKEVERSLAAHVLSLRDPRTKSVGVDVLSESYQGQWGMGLNGTSYGQMAILLDTSGILAKVAKTGGAKKASMTMIGYHE